MKQAPRTNKAVTQSTALSRDRLSFTVFLAIAIHGLLIFGLTFKSSEPEKAAPSVTITLATHQSTESPEDADFLAQSNQLASGSIDEAKEITTDVFSPFDSQFINDTEITQRRQQVLQDSDKQQVITSIDSRDRVNDPQQPDDKKDLSPGKGLTDVDSISARITSLKAKLTKQRQEYAKIPRQRVLTSVSTKAASEAAYLNLWTEKIENVGNRLFPQEALRRKITGKLRLEVVVNFDGTIVEVNLKQSSGHTILDYSARQIVYQASPFEPFPPEIRQNYDHMVIIRTWHFDISGLSMH